MIERREFLRRAVATAALAAMPRGALSDTAPVAADYTIRIATGLIELFGFMALFETV